MKSVVILLALLLAGSASAESKEKSVTLDVKDADVREVLQSMKTQCGIKNMLVDKEVSGVGMIYFREVPCETAFRVVFKQFGLAGRFEPNVVTVGVRRD